MNKTIFIHETNSRIAIRFCPQDKYAIIIDLEINWFDIHFIHQLFYNNYLCILWHEVEFP